MDDKANRAPRPIPLRLILTVFAALTAALAAGYFFFLRTDYAVLYSGVREADAAAIVAELDRSGVGYRLADGGTTILVPEGSADSVRLAIAGSEVPSRGAVGFELFNESDMGLTDFAQRINYQRALQGELARTIMMMSGIESARVHLALPERSLFRGARAEPRAAVTVTPTVGRAVDGARVAGIQRLVAAAVPDLAVADVVVLDYVGRVISPAAATEALLPPDLEEQEAVRQYYRARARAAVERALPGLEFDVRVSVLAETGATGADGWQSGAAAAGEGPAAAADGARNFRLRLVVLSEAPLDSASREQVRQAVAAAVRLDEEAGDGLVFSVAPIGAAAAAPAAAPAIEAVPADISRRPRDGAGWPDGWWTWLAAIAGIGVLLLALRPRGLRLAADDRDAMVRRIRAQLRLTEEGGDARA